MTKQLYVIKNPVNGLMWERHEQIFGSERTGCYSTYTSAARAEAAIRRNASLRHRGLEVVPAPN